MGVVDGSHAQMFTDDGMYESFIHVKFICLRRLSHTCNLMFTMLYLVKAKNANGTN